MHALNRLKRGGWMILALTLAISVPVTATAETIRIPTGRAHVVESTTKVTTIAIADPEVADGAVGSERTVVVNGKRPGHTSLVVYSEGGRYAMYDVQVYRPNADKQVLLRVRIAEVNEEAKKEIGFDWFGKGSSSVPWLDGTVSGGLFTTKVTSPSTPLGIGPETDGILSYTKGDGGWLAGTTWKALEENGSIRVLADPTLVARSGEKASFLAGGEFPVPIASAVSAGGATVTIEWKEFGVRLDFTPTVMEDGRVSLSVAPEVSQIDFTNPLVLSGFTVPTLITRKTETTVDLGQGEHLVVGGLKQNDRVKVVRRVPVLGHIPLLSFFFSNTRTETVERELMIVVSPEIVSPSTGAMPDMN